MTFFHASDGFWYADTPDKLPQTTFPATVRIISTHEILTLREDGSWCLSGRWSGILPSGVKNARDSMIQNAGTSSSPSSAVAFVPDRTRLSPPLIPAINGVWPTEWEWIAKEDGFLYVETGARSIKNGWLRLDIRVNDVDSPREDWNSTGIPQSKRNLLRISRRIEVLAGDKVSVLVTLFESLVEEYYVNAWFAPPKGVTLPTEPPNEGGSDFDIDTDTLRFEDNRLRVNTTDEAVFGNAQPITSGGVYKMLGNIQSLLEGI